MFQIFVIKLCFSNLCFLVPMNNFLLSYSLFEPICTICAPTVSFAILNHPIAFS